MRPSKLISATIFAMSVLMISAGLAVAGPPAHVGANGMGPAAKATGTVTWTARTHLPAAQQIPGIQTSFDAHDDAPGAQGDRGTVFFHRPDVNGFAAGTVWVDVECVNVDGGEAWFAGTVAAAEGAFSPDGVWLFHVVDNATPGAAGDQIGALNHYASLAAACTDVEAGTFAGQGVVTAGNLKTHDS